MRQNDDLPDNVVVLFPSFNGAAAQTGHNAGLMNRFHRARNHENNLFADIEKQRLEQIFRGAGPEWNYPVWQYHVGHEYSCVMLNDRRDGSKSNFLTLSKTAHKGGGYVYEVGFNRDKFSSVSVQTANMRFSSFERAHQAIRMALEAGPYEDTPAFQAVS